MNHHAGILRQEPRSPPFEIGGSDNGVMCAICSFRSYPTSRLYTSLQVTTCPSSSRVMSMACGSFRARLSSVSSMLENPVSPFDAFFCYYDSCPISPRPTSSSTSPEQSNCPALHSTAYHGNQPLISHTTPDPLDCWSRSSPSNHILAFPSIHRYISPPVRNFGGQKRVR